MLIPGSCLGEGVEVLEHFNIAQQTGRLGWAEVPDYPDTIWDWITTLLLR